MVSGVGELCGVSSAPSCTLIDSWTSSKICLWKLHECVSSFAFKQAFVPLLLYHKWQFYLWMLSSAKTSSWFLVIYCLVCPCHRNVRIVDSLHRYTAVNHQGSDRDRHSDRSVARPLKQHVSWQECIAYCIVGLCLWGERADSLDHRTLWGWGMWRSEEEELA